LAGLLTFGIGNTTEVFYFPGNSELTKIWLKIWVSTVRTTGKSNFMNDKGIRSTPAASDLMDMTASQISLSLTVANENSGGTPQIHQLHSAKVSSKNNFSNAQYPSQLEVSQRHWQSPVHAGPGKASFEEN
jgi:hypothetical protein